MLNLNACNACCIEHNGQRRVNEAKIKDAFEILPLFKKLKDLEIEKHFIYYLRENTTLEEIAILSVGSGLHKEEWFKRLLAISSHQDLILFNSACQTLVGKVLYFIEQTCAVSDHSKFSNFWYQIYYCIDKENMFKNDGLFSQLPVRLNNNQTWMCILLEMIVHLVVGWANDVAKKHEETKSDNKKREFSVEERNRQINGCAGFALSSAIKLYKREQHKSTLEDIEEKRYQVQSHLNEVSRFLKNMQILHTDALLNKECSLSYYANSHKMINHGGLTLITPQHIKFASLLMNLCHQETSKDQICKRAGNSFNAARKDLFGNKDLRESFDNAHCHQDFTPSMQKEINKICSLILIKTLCAKFGSELKKVREYSVGHCTKGSSKESLRSDLFHNNKRKMKKDGAKLKKESKRQKKIKFPEGKD